MHKSYIYHILHTFSKINEAFQVLENMPTNSLSLLLLYWHETQFPQRVSALLHLHSMTLSPGRLSHSLCHHVPIKPLNRHGDWSLIVCGRKASTVWERSPLTHLITKRTLWETWRRDLILAPSPLFFPSKRWCPAGCLVWSGLINQLMWCGREGGGRLSIKLKENIWSLITWC